ncbi:PLP-dependent transferase [Streptomyces sp. NPDC002623]
MPLPLRVPRHNANGQALAEALSAHPPVAKVHCPGLPTHPQQRSCTPTGSATKSCGCSPTRAARCRSARTSS